MRSTVEMIDETECLMAGRSAAEGPPGAGLFRSSVPREQPV